MTGSTSLHGRDVWLVDVNNVRGTQSFPELSSFCDALRRWAAAQSGAALIILAVDHGECAQAFPLSNTTAIAFSGDTDADTVIVHAVDLLVSSVPGARPREINVVTSDHLLRQRCTHEVPTTTDEAPLGAKRGRQQLALLSFVGSAGFAHGLSISPSRTPCRSRSPGDVFSVSPPRLQRAEQENPPPQSRQGRRRAQRRAAERDVIKCSAGEKTADRTRAALALQRRVAARCPQLNQSGVPHSLAREWCRWYAGACPMRMVRPANVDGALYELPAWCMISPGACVHSSPGREAAANNRSSWTNGADGCTRSIMSSMVNKRIRWAAMLALLLSLLLLMIWSLAIGLG